ncbi:raffinose/stachyose/melibiose transport system permease protein [Streptococcus gallinaceus]|uniref:carbohydrate ABC transporter permease n=1 Tax=Streptococcus gallinaceus TaxID=165758 RepID=UPI0020A2134D|nr:carbohydrate ABC transporter permease [Streptococcus gallinaceus]MCP1638479.1 raffinose/stachyose/melibiose transport system permease protein [Streptococcus gallinaceus]MCP1769434.1 raffinose/stachyose/melibiose transport system permease protein [Streptococcus gallinaceus]
MKAKKQNHILAYIVLIAGIFLMLIPLAVTLISSFKSTADITGNFFGLPKEWTLSNYERLFTDGISTYFMNSTFMTVVSVGLIILVIPMAAFSIARHMDRKKIFSIMYTLLIIGMFVPFQVIMLSMSKLMSDLGMTNLPGLTVLYLTYAIPQTLFLYVGYIKTIVPTEMDEAAAIDGAGKFTMYWKIIFPLMKPMHATVLIINALWVWNDFLMPLLVLNRDNSLWTMPLFQYNYQGQYFSDYGPSFASYVVGIIPILIVYLIFQKNIISGMTSGSVK